jgi:hypothetical protein
MLAVSSLQETWPMLIIISVALWLMQQVDWFNDRAHRPIPGAYCIWELRPVPQGELFGGRSTFSS